MTDPGRLRQLFENLFSNAVAHAGPTVHVEVLDRYDSPTTPPGVDCDPTDAGFVVDDGPGIPPEDRDRVFDYGVSSRSNSTGFGLAIVRRVAEAHGWSVSVTDAPNGGASFEFRGVEQVAPSDPTPSETQTDTTDDDTVRTD